MVESTSNHLITDIESSEKFLQSNGITFKVLLKQHNILQTVKHQQVFTIPEMLQHVKFEGEHEKAMFAKNLFLQNKKKKDQMYLVIAAHDTNIDMKALTKHFKAGSGNLRAGDQEDMQKLLGVAKGAVSVFSIVNDTENKVKLVIDERLMNDFEYVAFHPMQNDATTAITNQDFKKFIELSKHKPEIINFAKLATEEQAPKEESKQAKPAQPEEPQGNLLGIQFKKEDNFSKWYQQIITKSEMIEYYDISGCYILRPLAFFVWEHIQQCLDPLFKSHGVQNCYFPMFVSNAALCKEKNHLEGFSPEVAWVTKSGSSDLPEPIAIRPTSETIMYPSFAKWIHSHRDLPLLLNQWTNVVRWEFKHPTPFIRTREFLWQEGHTAHTTSEEADKMVLNILDNYAQCYKEKLAVPTIKGRKSEEEKFAGADYTTTVELYVPVNGRGIQGATSHHLGQNFAKMFDVWFEDQNKEKQYAWQTSWGFSTRSIGAMIMIHSDNKGLVLPPPVAQIQVVLVPIVYKEDDPNAIMSKINEIYNTLKVSGIRVHLDDRENYNPGFKYNHWELRGVPVRIELGKKDLDKAEVRIVRRDTGNKQQMKIEELSTKMPQLLTQIHEDMYEKARKSRDEHIKEVETWETFMEAVNQKNICLTPWCNEKACEKQANERSKLESLQLNEQSQEGEEILTGAAKTLCIPFDQTPLKDGAKCFACGQPAKTKALWGRSY